MFGKILALSFINKVINTYKIDYLNTNDYI